jgi:hypothetical protein
MARASFCACVVGQVPEGLNAPEANLAGELDRLQRDGARQTFEAMIAKIDGPRKPQDAFRMPRDVLGVLGQGRSWIIRFAPRF